MFLGFAIAAAVLLALADRLERIKRKGLLLNSLILIITTAGLFSCSASVFSIAGCQRTHFACHDADCE